MLVTSILFAVIAATANSRIYPGLGLTKFPSISNSMVNFGKMDITFHLNNDVPAARHHDPVVYPQLGSIEKTVEEEPCLCSAIKNYAKDASIFNRPSELLNKVLMSNDLFSYSKDPVSSSLCCDDQIQEETVVFELPRSSKFSGLSKPANTIDSFPISFLDELLSNRPTFPKMKPKEIEIFLFPKKKEQPRQTKNVFPNKDVQIVGGKELKNEFSNDRFKPGFKTSVKKDLNVQEKKVDQKSSAISKRAYTETTTTENPMAVNLNVL